MWFIHAVGYYLAIKKEKNACYKAGGPQKYAKWYKDLSYTTYWMIAFNWNAQKRQICVETENKWVVVWVGSGSKDWMQMGLCEFGG